MRYLITQTLLGSYQYLFSVDPEYFEGALADFEATLRRERREPTEAMLNGINFENLVYAKANGISCEPHKKWQEGINLVASVIKGAQIQVKAKRELTVNCTDFLLYGILDGLKAGVIYDVKFLNKGIGGAELAGKYLNSPQHPAYFALIPEANMFQYLVSDGKDIYVETYLREQTESIEKHIQEFMQGIEAMCLLDVYKAHWQAL